MRCLVSRQFFLYGISAALALINTHSPLANDRIIAPKRDYLMTPDVKITSDGQRVDIERGLIFVPENRNNPNSRTIAVHFIRFPAAQKSAKSTPPVFMYPGGPGEDLNFPGTSTSFDIVQRLRRRRDVVYVSQRGYPDAPGLVPRMNVIGAVKPTPLDRPASIERMGQQFAEAYATDLSYWAQRGVDVTGYDINNIASDVYDLRAALGYDKIILRGSSFASQLSFYYMKRWPETVDRAMLGGVEPLDYAYDSPKWLWAAFGRLAAEAEQNTEMAPYIPNGGLMNALETIFIRLENEPVTVDVIDPNSRKNVQITVGADDLSLVIRQTSMFQRGDVLANRAVWPRFVIELYNGDYRSLAIASLIERANSVAEGPPLMNLLIDNSFGISKQRDKLLLAEKTQRWLKPNWGYRATRDVLGAAPQVSQETLKDWDIDLPVLLMAGTYDWFTPSENAKHAANFLKNGHLMIVEGATHSFLFQPKQLTGQYPEIAEALYSFVDADFSQTSAASIFAKLPTKVTLAPLAFEVPNGVSLYDEMLMKARNGEN
ncbi:MAG: alpha/beta hydrolase [Pseudomonadota bacterium]